MKTVVMYGSSDDSVFDEIINLISPCGLIVYDNNNIYKTGGDKEDFLILKSAVPLNAEIPRGIFVFLNKIDSFINLKIPKDFVGITRTTNSSALKLLQKSENDTITCGMASNDTLTLSSNSNNSVSVSLQRKIKTLSNNIVVPSEYPLKICNSFLEYSLLAACAILLLSDYNPHNIINNI